MRWGLEHPNAYALVYSAPRVGTAMWDEAVNDLSAQCYEIYCSVVREIAAQGRLRTGSADSAAQSSWMACHGVVALLTARPGFNWAPTDELIQVTLEGLMYGMVTD
jgi:hypothetical protein